MPDATLPLIPLASPRESERPAERQRAIPRPRTPGFARQADRLGPAFAQLQQAMRDRTVQIQDAIAATPVEQVLVIETIGDVQDFERAVRLIPGLEWLFESEEKTDPDEDFYFENSRDKAVDTRLFLVMSDESAVTDLLRLWQRFLDAPEAAFPVGLAKWKNVFQQLKELRLWNEHDRLEQETLDYWRDELASGKATIRFEVEVWFSSSPEKNLAARQALGTFVAETGGRVLSWAEIQDIRYHAALIELPAVVVQRILDGDYPRLVLYQRVMFFRPRALGMSSSTVGDLEFVPLEAPGPDQQPVIALLDGLPLENHQALVGRLSVDDPDGWAATYPAASRIHGTGTASLVLHGDLTKPDGPLKSRLYVRPILRPDSNGTECTPDDQLLVDVVHRAVRRMFEGEAGQPPASPTVRVVNLSVGDDFRLFNRQLSPWARLLDWLSWKYKLLFCVSAGNSPDVLTLGVLRRDLPHMTRQDLQSEVLQAAIRGAGTRVLLNPAESVNAVTVGAAYSDFSTFPVVPGRYEIFETALPAPYSRAGLGYRGAIKPDMLFPGGRQLYSEVHGPSTEPAALQQVSSGRPPGQRVASPALAGQANGYAYTRGTSNAAALASRHCGRLWEVLQSMQTPIDGLAIRGPDVALLKALLVHGATWADMRDIFENLVTTGTRRARKDALAKLLGFGLVNTSMALGCTPERATLLACRMIAPEYMHEYRIPLPPSLSGAREWRRLTITLAYICPTMPTRRAYRAVKVSFDPPGETLQVSRVDADHNAVQIGTVQHEVLEGNRAVAYVDGDELVVPVTCRALAAGVDSQIPYGLCLSLEVAQGVAIPVYHEIRARVQPVVRVAA